MCRRQSLINHGTFHDLFAVHDDSLISKGFSIRTEQLTQCFEPREKLSARLVTRLICLSLQ